MMNERMTATAEAKALLSPTPRFSTGSKSKNSPTQKPTQLLVSDLSSRLLNDLNTIPWRIEALTPIMERCVTLGELEIVDYYAIYFTVGGNVMLDISDDMADGVMDHYDARYIHNFIQETHATLDEIEAQCSR